MRDGGKERWREEESRNQGGGWRSGWEERKTSTIRREKKTGR